VLIVEDDFLLLSDLEMILLEGGAGRVDSCRTIEEALARANADDIEAAVLDVRVGHESIAPVARQLAARGIPFVFYTGQVGNDRMIAEWPGCKIVSKPAQSQVIVAAIAELLRH